MELLEGTFEGMSVAMEREYSRGEGMLFIL